MKSAFLPVATALTLGILLPLAATAQTALPTGNESGSISESRLIVDGSGTINRPPDEARVSVSIVSNADVASQSAGDNTRTYNTFVARVGKIGLAADAVRTTFYNVQFVPPPPKGLPPEQRQSRYGYITTRSLSITVAPLENVGKVIDAATAVGVDQVGDVSFDLRDRQSAYAAALVAAMSDAKRTATTLAAARYRPCTSLGGRGRTALAADRHRAERTHQRHGPGSRNLRSPLNGERTAHGDER